MPIIQDDLDARICSVVAKHGHLSTDAISNDIHADLYEAGMTSHATVNVMLALEGEFDVEFPDEMLNRSVFTSVASIRNALRTLVQT
jgi:acyl carrier protein